MSTRKLFGRFFNDDAIDPAQRLRLDMCRNAGLIYVVFASILVMNIPFGTAPKTVTLILAATELLSAVVFYGLIRSGWNLRAADPSLTLPQLALGYVFTLCCYAVLGASAPAVMITIGSQIVYTVFTLPPRTVRIFAGAYVVGIGLTAWACNHFDPVRYPADVQITTFAYACLVIPLLASMAKRVTSMSERLRANRRELEQALQKVQELATRDELTRIHNRRHLTELMEGECIQHRRSAKPLCVAVLDIDLFKSVNDRYGHKVGDEVLRRFAFIAGKVLRASDLLGRWGGEEFLVMFPSTGTDEALAALQRLRDRLVDEDLGSMAPGLRVTYSGGLTLVAAEETLDAAIERADQAMYRAKKAGRNRCIVV